LYDGQVRLAEFDVNGDGSLSLAEFDVLHAAMGGFRREVQRYQANLI